MYNILNKHGQAIALGLGILVTAIFLISVLTGLSGSGYDMGTDLNALGDEDKANINFFNPGLRITLALVVVGAIAWVGFGLYHLISAPKDSVKFIISIGIIIILFFVFYSMATPETTGKVYELTQREGISEGVSKGITGALRTCLILGAIAAAAMVVSETRNLFK